MQMKGRRGPVDSAEYDRLMGNLETFAPSTEESSVSYG